MAPQSLLLSSSPTQSGFDEKQMFNRAFKPSVAGRVVLVVFTY